VTVTVSPLHEILLAMLALVGLTADVEAHVVFDVAQFSEGFFAGNALEHLVFAACGRVDHVLLSETVLVYCHSCSSAALRNVLFELLVSSSPRSIDFSSCHIHLLFLRSERLVRLAHGFLSLSFGLEILVLGVL